MAWTLHTGHDLLLLLYVGLKRAYLVQHRRVGAPTALHLLLQRVDLLLARRNLRLDSGHVCLCALAGLAAGSLRLRTSVGAQSWAVAAVAAAAAQPVSARCRKRSSLSLCLSKTAAPLSSPSDCVLLSVVACPRTLSCPSHCRAYKIQPRAEVIKICAQSLIGPPLGLFRRRAILLRGRRGGKTARRVSSFFDSVSLLLAPVFSPSSSSWLCDDDDEAAAAEDVLVFFDFAARLFTPTISFFFFFGAVPPACCFGSGSGVSECARRSFAVPCHRCSPRLSCCSCASRRHAPRLRPAHRPK